MQNNCPVCYGTSISILHTVKDDFLSGENFEIWRCSDCQFSFTMDYPPEDGISKYYKSEDYISHSNTKKGLVNQLYHLARKWMLRRKLTIVRKASGLYKGTILDIGCGTGHFAASMKAGGWESIGIEADGGAKKIAEEEFGLEVHSLDELTEFKSSSFDVISLWHVLEHLYSPKEVITMIADKLKENGKCIIALPNSDSFDSLHYKEKWAAWDVPRHLWHFNLPSIEKLVDKSGLKLFDLRRMPLDAFYISMLSEKYRGSGLGVFKGFIMGFAGFFLSIFNISKSSSIIYILSKES